MELNFEIIEEIGEGAYPDVIHFYNTQGAVFHVKEGELYNLPTAPLDYGDWENANFLSEMEVSPDRYMSHLQLDVLQGYGIFGTYKSDGAHKLIIHSFYDKELLLGGNVEV